MHRPKAPWLSVASLALVTAALCAGEPLMVFAAVSTSGPLEAIARDYEAATGVAVTCSFASSSTLAKQIAAGAPADLFLSADQGWMDYLAERAAIVAASRVDLLANDLVLVTPVDRPLAVRVDKNFAFAASFAGRIALGDPTNVPAGIYAREAFVALGWWDALAGRLAPTADVRAALKLVELGEVEVGVVYATDAKASAKVVIAATIPSDLHTPIRYPVALTVAAKPTAAAFLAHLLGEEAHARFREAGFAFPVVAGPPAVAAP